MENICIKLWKIFWNELQTKNCNKNHWIVKETKKILFFTKKINFFCGKTLENNTKKWRKIQKQYKDQASIKNILNQKQKSEKWSVGGNTS